MKMKSNCCAETYCQTTIAELPRYYPRQLITPDDLTLEQNYFRDRMRRHNRLMHGWGVVCGALVCPVTWNQADGTTSFAPWQVKIGTGYILGPYGDEIVIDCERTVDLRTRGVAGVTGEPCIDAPDPWCTQVFVAPTEQSTLYVAVKYKQCMTRPVRVQPVGCGCDDTACEYSRWQDGYEIGVLPERPPCHDGQAPFNPCNKPPLFDLTDMCAAACPDCSCGPWVMLAIVTIDPDGTIRTIDNCSGRRMAVSLSQLWWNCTSDSTPVHVVGAPVEIHSSGAAVPVTVTGTNLSADAIYSFGDGISVRNAQPTAGRPLGTSIDLSVSALAGAVAGKRPLKVVKQDCTISAVTDAVNIVRDQPLPQAGPSPMETNTASIDNLATASARQPTKATKARASKRKKP
jgi:hypothetical protein